VSSALLGGGVASWPMVARAQQGRLLTIGFLAASTEAASEEGQRLPAFLQRLNELDWIEVRTVSIQYRWAGGRSERVDNRCPLRLTPS
jgi:putative ABC transport system substrate-binding protein